MTAISVDDAKVLNDLLLDFVTEIELHYEDEDFFALAPSFAKIKAGVAILERDQYPVHPDIKKVVARFHQAQN